MTLNELFCACTVEGDVRIKVYDNDKEMYVVNVPGNYETKRKYLDWIVTFIYPGDGGLVIEVKKPE